MVIMHAADPFISFFDLPGLCSACSWCCRPIYTWSIYGNNFKSDVNVAEDLRNSLEEVFYQYQVDLTWAGHVHLYGVRLPILRPNDQPKKACNVFGKVALLCCLARIPTNSRTVLMDLHVRL